MMGGWANAGEGLERADVSPDMRVSPMRAVEAEAQGYLDSHLPGTTASEAADPFYGYFTQHVLRDGKITGMLSVNGFTGAVFPHSWHGTFITMSGE